MLVKAACSPGQAFSNQVSLFLSLLHPSSFLAISYRDLGFFFFPFPAAYPAASPETPGTAATRAIPGQQQGILGTRLLRLLRPPASHRFFPGNVSAHP